MPPAKAGRCPGMGLRDKDIRCDDERITLEGSFLQTIFLCEVTHKRH